MLKKEIFYADLPIYYNKIIDKIDNLSLDLKFDAIYAIPKGGLPIAIHLCNFYDKKLILTINQLNNEFLGKNILVIDDICDTGFTFKKVLSKINDKITVFTCCLFYKNKSIFTPDIFIEKVSDNIWVVFPWEPRNSRYNHTEIF